MMSRRSIDLDQRALELAHGRVLPIGRSSQIASYSHLNSLTLHNDLTVALAC